MKIGSWERKLWAQAREHRDSPTHWRHYREHRPGARFYLNVKEYDGFPPHFADRLCARYRIDAGTAAEILQTVYEWHRDRFWEDADECARFIFNGDESGDLPRGLADPRAIVISGGRGGGWISANVPILSEIELSQTRDGLKTGTAKDWRKVVKWARSLGRGIDYLLSWDAVVETVKGNTHVWDLEEPEDRQRRECAEQWGEMARASD